MPQTKQTDTPSLAGPIDVEIHVPPDVLDSVTEEYRRAVEHGYSEPLADFLMSRTWVRNERVQVDAVALDIEPADG